MQDLTRMARSCRLTSGARSATHTPAGQRPQGVWRLASVGDSAKSKDKEKGKAEHRECIFSLALIVFDNGKPTRERNRPEARGWRTAWQNPNDMVYNGDIKKTTPTVRPECSKLISQLYQTEGYLDAGNGLNDKQGKIKKKSNGCVTT